MTQPKKPSQSQSCDLPLKSLRSKNQEECDWAITVFKGVGVPAAELLISEARSKRLSLESRLRYLRVAGEIGVPLDRGTANCLQELMEEGPHEIMQEVVRIVADASPEGAAGVWRLPAITGLMFGEKAFVTQCRRTLMAATRKERAQARAERRAWFREP